MEIAVDNPSLPAYPPPPNEATPALTPVARPGGEVKQLRKPAQFKVGVVLVTQGKTPKGGRSFYELRYVDRGTGKEVKRRVADTAREKVVQMAEELTVKALQGKGYLAAPRAKAPGIGEALAETIRLSRARPETQANYAVRARMFTRWLADRYAAVETWDQLRPAMIETYARAMEEKGRAWHSVRLNLVPIKSAWRRMADNYPDLVRPLPRIKQAERPPRKEIECLEADEVNVLLAWLRENARDVWPIATLQALAGLRMLEAAALRFEDVDFKAGTLTVTDTGHHRPKTRDSYRTIPLCAEALEALSAAAREQRVRPTSGELFTNHDGGLWKVNALTVRMMRTLERAAAAPVVKVRSNGRPMPVNKNGLGVPRLDAFPAHRLRAAFATMAIRLEVPDRLVKAYMGHAPGDMLGGHYLRIDTEELRLVSDRIGERRIRFAGREDRKHSGNIPVRATMGDSVEAIAED